MTIMLTPRDFLVIEDLPLANKTVLLRVDINSPVDPGSGRILGFNRIKAHLETIRKLKDTKLVILAHQSKPGKADFISLAAHADSISTLLKYPVNFIDDLIGKQAQNAIKNLNAGEIIILENVRFYSEEVILNGESVNTLKHTHIVKNLAGVSDFFINDAFAAAHRQQPSLVGFTETLPSAAGLVMEQELTALNWVLSSKQHPCVAILGGAKVKDSLEVAENMLKNKIADQILTTGLVANLFFMAQGKNLGKPNVKFMESEFKDLKSLIDIAKDMLKRYKNKIELPVDMAVNNKGKRVVQYLTDLPAEFPIYDIGLETVVKYSNILKDAKIIIANGPAGVFEIDEFSFGTNEMFYAIANSKAYSVLGGGETITAVNRLGIFENIDHISTGGGACINYLAGRSLPVVEALKKSKTLFEKKIKK